MILNELATKHSSDKWNSHWYTKHYERHFQHLRETRFNLLEIGFGGHENPSKGGCSLRMWKEFFPLATISSIDIYEKTVAEERIRFFRGSQDDEEFLQRVNAEAGPFRVIIDDGSHHNQHMIKSFAVLFPLLENDGIYAIEDLQTSYWEAFGGDSGNLNNPATVLNHLKTLIDSVNYVERASIGYAPTYVEKHLTGVHFYHNLCLIDKGTNDEGTNFGMFATPTLLHRDVCMAIRNKSDEALRELVPSILGPELLDQCFREFAEKARQLADSGLDHVEFRVDAFDGKKTYLVDVKNGILAASTDDPVSTSALVCLGEADLWRFFSGQASVILWYTHRIVVTGEVYKFQDLLTKMASLADR